MTPDRKIWLERRAAQFQRAAAIGYARAEMFVSLEKPELATREQYAAWGAAELAADLMGRLIHGEG